MGTDITTWIEVREADSGKWKLFLEPIFPGWDEGDYGCKPFDWRTYAMFGILANVRNYAAIEPIAMPRGWPSDTEVENDDCHSKQWYLLSELLSFDWDKECENRRCDVHLAVNIVSGAGTAKPGEGFQTTYREQVGSKFMKELDIMRDRFPQPDMVRILMSFDC